MEKRLKKLKGKKLIAVMDDGEAFLGTLIDFDKDTLVLTEVCEGPSSQIEWSSLDDEEPQPEEGYGFVDWVCVNLEEVIIRVDHVSRLWPWKHRKEYFEDQSKKRTPTYTRTPALDMLAKQEEKEEE
ncbi:MAG: hypothetical protein KGY68_03570 [Candidatus Thermoplasmatota archaeon]|nr:hypothetical protein [Candidatus Thermoplasmatota archaeon]